MSRTVNDKGDNLHKKRKLEGRLKIIQEETKDLEWDLMRGSEDAGDEELQAERLESVSIKKQCSGDQSALKYPKSSCAPGSVSILAFCKSPSAQLSYYM